MAGEIGSIEVMEILNDEQQFGKQLGLQLKLARYIDEKRVNKVRTLLSGFGKSRQGFDNLEPELKEKAFNLMKANGFVPLVEHYRTPQFSVIKIQVYEAIPRKQK